MEKAVFLDRDGVIIKDVGHIRRLEDIKLIKGSAKAISELNDEYNIFIISNQAAVGRGLCDEETAFRINDKLVDILKKEDAIIDNSYLCFHHPIHGVGKYKLECECRKPNPGMILEAAKEFNIDLKKSWMIGDKTSDIKAGRLAGVKTILVKTGYGGNDRVKDAIPHFTTEDLYAASQLILQGDKK